MVFINTDHLIATFTVHKSHHKNLDKEAPSTYKRHCKCHIGDQFSLGLLEWIFTVKNL